MKYDLEQTVYYMFQDHICSSQILGRRFIEVCKRVRFIQGMGASWSDRMGTYYYTSHGEFAEDRLFPTKEDLVKNLLKEV